MLSQRERQNGLDRKSLRRRLLNWFDRHQRDLPWRKNKTPYRIWISEIMLQQTQVATVIDYYRRFMDAFPDVATLASADQSEVLKQWEGLGYYRRARMMHQAAQVIAEKHGGQFPIEFEDVLSLPGIGRYTAGAILSIALDQPHPILEGNTIRLFARLMTMRSDPRSAENQRELWEFSKSLLPRKRCGDFNQALMELGSEICTPTKPACDQCPLQAMCPTFVQGLVDSIPATGKKIAYESIEEAVVVVARRGKFLLRICGEGERWTGLWDFPRFSFNSKSSAPSGMDAQLGNRVGYLSEQLRELTGLDVEVDSTGVRIKHAVTRFRILLHVFRSKRVTGRTRKKSGEQWKWASLADLVQIPLSATGRKIANQIRSGKLNTEAD